MAQSAVIDAVSKGNDPTKGLFQQRQAVIDQGKADSAGLDRRADDAVMTSRLAREEVDTLTKKEREPGGALVPPKLDPAPVPKQTGLMEMFGSPAMWIASFGGLMTRNPMKTSLNAAAGVMNAYRERDFATAQKQYDAWKAETANALKLHDFQLDTYKAALAKADKDSAAAMGEFRTYAAAFQDKTAMRVAETGGIDAAIRHVDAMAQHSASLRASMPAVERFNAEAQALGALTQARQGLEAAKRTGDPAKVQAATEAVEAAKTRMQDVQRAYQPGYAAAELRDDTSRRGQDLTAQRQSDALALKRELGERALDQGDERIKNSRWYQEQMIDLRGRGLDEQAARRELTERIAVMRDDTTRRGQDTRAAAAGEKDSAKRQAVVDNYDLAIDQIDNLIDMAQKNDGVTGLGGRGRRLLETGAGVLGVGDGKTPASDFESALETFRLEAPKLITGASKSAKDERARIDRVLRGTSAGDTKDKTVNSLNQVRDLLTKRRDGLHSGTEPVEGEEGGARAPSSLIEDAKGLLKHGAPREAVEKILRDQGVDPSELGL